MALSVLYTYIRWDYNVVQNKMEGVFMKHNKNYSLQKELADLRLLEKAAWAQFMEAKNSLIQIKKQIKRLEELLSPPSN